MELENGLKILLISDPETDKAAAAMDVHIGQSCCLTSSTTANNNFILDA